MTQRFANATIWFAEWMLPTLEGRWGGSDGRILCPEWASEHPYVVLRVDALWRAWEQMVPKNASTWWIYHADAHARAIFDRSRGPMYACGDGHQAGASQRPKLIPAPVTVAVDRADDVGPNEPYSDVGQWVTRWLGNVLEARRVGGCGHVICPQWWEHPVVVLRLYALWRAWEQAARRDDMSTWWVYHYDTHARVLFDAASGPMYACRDGHRAAAYRPPHMVADSWTPPGWDLPWPGDQT